MTAAIAALPAASRVVAALGRAEDVEQQTFDPAVVLDRLSAVGSHRMQAFVGVDQRVAWACALIPASVNVGAARVALRRPKTAASVWWTCKA
jgi:hypothetical protein